MFFVACAVFGSGSHCHPFITKILIANILLQGLSHVVLFDVIGTALMDSRKAGTTATPAHAVSMICHYNML